MKLSDALRDFGPCRGQTSVIAALLGGGDVKSVTGEPRKGESLKEARAQLARYEEAQEACRSDAAWWGYMGDISYWRAVISLLEAAELVGADNLPDLPYTVQGGFVMDICSRQESWGKEVLEAAKRRASATPVTSAGTDKT